MHTITQYRCRGFHLTIWLIGLVAVGCRQSNLLGAGGAVNAITLSALESSAGAEGGFLAALTQFNNTVAQSGQGLLNVSGLLSDELSAQVIWIGSDVSYIDGRYTSANEAVGAMTTGDNEIGDIPLIGLLQSRSALLLLIGPLVTYEPGASRSQAGMVYALAGYTELYMAEDYCAGVTLDRALPNGGVAFGASLTADSLLGTAIGHFDSALANAYGVDSVTYLARVGLGRAWLDRGQFDSAAHAVATVPTNFVYNVTSASQDNYNSGAAGALRTNMYELRLNQATQCCSYCADQWNVSNLEGGNGMDYVSANDERLALASGGETCDFVYYGVNGLGGDYGLTDSTWHMPLKFGASGQSINIPIATGVEAALIGAEAGMSGAAHSTSQMLASLQQLRQNSARASTYLQLDSAVSAMTPDSLNATGSEAVAILFRERAFWLFGAGTRLGDMRREARQYPSVLGPNAVDLVYPTGTYSQGILAATVPGLIPFQQYGTDVVMPLPTTAATQAGIVPASLNPNYKGCTSATTVP